MLGQFVHIIYGLLSRTEWWHKTSMPFQSNTSRYHCSLYSCVLGTNLHLWYLFKSDLFKHSHYNVLNIVHHLLINLFTLCTSFTFLCILLLICLLCYWLLMLSLPLCLGAVVIAFVVCWLPYHARRLMFCYVSYWSE